MINQQLETSENRLLDCIKQYAKELHNIKKEDGFFETRRYIAIWHYLDGMSLSYFVITGMIVSFDTDDGNIQIHKRMEEKP
jgi:hypothetical protein